MAGKVNKELLKKCSEEVTIDLCKEEVLGLLGVDCNDENVNRMYKPESLDFIVKKNDTDYIGIKFLSYNTNLDTTSDGGVPLLDMNVNSCLCYPVGVVLITNAREVAVVIKEFWEETHKYVLVNLDDVSDTDRLLMDKLSSKEYTYEDICKYYKEVIDKTYVEDMVKKCEERLIKSLHEVNDTYTAQSCVDRLGLEFCAEGDGSLEDLITQVRVTSAKLMEQAKAVSYKAVLEIEKYKKIIVERDNEIALLKSGKPVEGLSEERIKEMIREQISETSGAVLNSESDSRIGNKILFDEGVHVGDDDTVEEDEAEDEQLVEEPVETDEEVEQSESDIVADEEDDVTWDDAEDEPKSDEDEQFEEDDFSDENSEYDDELEIKEEAIEKPGVYMVGLRNMIELLDNIPESSNLEVNALVYEGRKPFVVKQNPLVETTSALLSLVSSEKASTLFGSDFRNLDEIGTISDDNNGYRIPTTQFTISKECNLRGLVNILNKMAEEIDVDSNKLYITVVESEVNEELHNSDKYERLEGEVVDNEDVSIDMVEDYKVLEVDENILRSLLVNEKCKIYLEALVKRVVSVKYDGLTDTMIKSDDDKAEAIWNILVNAAGGEEKCNVKPKLIGRVLGSSKLIISDAVSEVSENHSVIEINGRQYCVSNMNDVEFIFAICAIALKIVRNNSIKLVINTEIDYGTVMNMVDYESGDSEEALTVRRIVDYISGINN